MDAAILQRSREIWAAKGLAGLVHAAGRFLRWRCLPRFEARVIIQIKIDELCLHRQPPADVRYRRATTQDLARLNAFIEISIRRLKTGESILAADVVRRLRPSEPRRVDRS